MDKGVRQLPKVPRRYKAALERPLQWIHSFFEEFVVSHALQISLLILTFALAFLLYFWLATNGMPRIQDQTESFNSYLAAENLYNHGLWNLRLLEDWATSPDSVAHPYLYTHNPDFPNLYSYVLLRLGITSLPYQNLTAVFILLVGFWYFYKAISAITRSPLAGLIALSIAATDYLGALVMGANLYRSWTWLLFWGTIYHLVASGQSAETRRGRIHFIAAVALYFLTVYYEYGIALLLTSTLFFIKLFGIYAASWKRHLTFIFATAIPSFAIHALLVISAIGFVAWFKDLTMTITNRALGTPTRETLEQFYAEHHLVLWGYPKLSLDALIHFLTRVFPERIETIFGTATLWILGLSAVIAVWYIINQGIRILGKFIHIKISMGSGVYRPARSRLRKLSRSLYEAWTTTLDLYQSLPRLFSSSARFMGALALSYLVVFLVFPGQTMYLYIGPFVPFFVLFLDALRGLFLWVVLQSGLVAIGKRLYIHGSIFLLLSLAFIAHTASVELGNFNANYPAPFGSALVLEKYRGYSSVTNFQSSYVRYFTKERTTVMGWDNKPIEEPFESKYTFERDYSINPQKYQQPDYAILQAGHNQPISSEITRTLRRLYPMVEAGADYEIYNLQERLTMSPEGGPGGTPYIQIPLSPDLLQVSSANGSNEAKQNLVDGNPMSNWHVKFPTETEEHWIIIDMGSETIVQALGIMPNVNSPNQIWDQDHATIQGSHDKRAWSNIALLVVDKGTLEKDTPQWLYYAFQNNTAYKYYRILIQDDIFLSMAEIELYQRDTLVSALIATLTPTPPPKAPLAETVQLVDETMVALVPIWLQVSSANGPNEDRQNLTDGNPMSNWHVKFPPDTTEHWILIDLGKDDNLEALGIMPNVNSPNQIWDKDHAAIQGSADKVEWTNIARLFADKNTLEKDNPQWLYYTFQNTSAYRYYRILIRDDIFLSLAEVELYGKEVLT
jgi:hypothetical protein